MRVISIRIATVVATVLFAVGIATSWQSVEAGLPDMDQEFREGQVVSIDKNDETITIREYSGLSTYRLSPTGRQDLDNEHIKPGDKVRFMVYGVWGVAYQFWRL
ncbi:MAG: hypothetical protein HY574_02265 [candidate division NC10 bacterium]|nr:hypothetical protein [candidate division NC10 bacterium]